MNEPRNRARKVTRKAGPPEATEQQPVFQAPSDTPANGGGNDAPAERDGGNNGNNGNDNRDDNAVSYTHLTLPTSDLV